MTAVSQPPAITLLPQKRITLEEFVAMGEGPPYYEFEDGLLIPRNGEDDPMVSPTCRHQRLLLRLAYPIDEYLVANPIGEAFMVVDVYLPDGKMYIPDITFVAANGGARLDPEDDKVHGVPELVVEILSDNQRRDRVHKQRVYRRNGVQWYWLIDPITLVLEELRFLPDGSVTINTIDRGEDFQPAAFPRLTLNLAALMGEQAETIPTDTPSASKMP